MLSLLCKHLSQPYQRHGGFLLQKNERQGKGGPGKGLKRGASKELLTQVKRLKATVSYESIKGDSPQATSGLLDLPAELGSLVTPLAT